ncbi:MAG: glutathione S-transferase family protein [Alphaproteobacteria bacterium]|nr:glutathione S-transferase family protein [Alphaproteobacteria bacterium]
MIDVFVRPTTLTQRATVMLEESGLPYRAVPVPWGSTDPTYVATGARGRTPAIIDQDGPGGEPLSLTQSVAILIHLAEKSGKLLPTDPRARATCLEWTMMLATDIYPPYAAVYFMSWLDEPKLPAAAWFEDRAIAEYAALDARLARSAYVGGAAFTIADIAGYPSAVLGMADLPALGRFQNVRRWMDLIGARPKVQAGMAAVGEGRPRGLVASRSA